MKTPKEADKYEAREVFSLVCETCKKDLGGVYWGQYGDDGTYGVICDECLAKEEEG